MDASIAVSGISFIIQQCTLTKYKYLTVQVSSTNVMIERQKGYRGQQAIANQLKVQKVTNNIYIYNKQQQPSLLVPSKLG
jgi:hypothetical protein